MNQNPAQIDEDEIDLKEVFRTINRYKLTILTFVVLFTLGAVVFAYFKPNVYQARATVEISDDKASGGQGDILAMAMEGGSANVDTEIEIVKSIAMTQKALEKVDLSHRYYTTRLWKEIELYKSSPFRVGMLNGYDISFMLKPIDTKRYRLVVEEAKDENKTVWNYNKIHFYDQEVVTPRFHLNVLKKAEMTAEAYRFVVIDPKKIARVVQKEVSVSQVSKKASVIAISYTDNVALRAEEFTNALSDAYVLKNIETKNREAELKLQFIDKQLKRITEDLKASAVQLEEFKKTSNTLDIGHKATSLLQQMNGYQTQLTQMSIRQEMLDTLYEQVKTGNNLESVSVSGLNMNMDQSSLSEIIKELQDARAQKTILRQDYTELYPGVRKLKQKIKQLKTTLISTIKGLRKSITQNRQLLEKSIDTLQAELNTLPANERVYGELERTFAVNEKIYLYLLEKQSEVGIVKASTVSQNIILDRAFFPEEPIKPKRKLIVLVGMILGFIVGIALAFLRVFLDDCVKNEDDIAHGTAVTLLGSIPFMQDDSNGLTVFSSPKSAVSEAFRNLRTNLQFMPKEEKSHIIAITSTVGGEGKTTIGINLAGIMSMTGKRTIILNLDMRKPTLHQKFGLQNKAGMSNVLSKSAELEDVIQHSEFENLDVITSGPVPPNPSELIQDEFMEKVFESLKENYDVIIVDTPPIGLVTDARTLMHYADTSIYVVRSGYSKKEYLKNLNKLAKDDISNFSVLLNAVKMQDVGYGYYGYGYYEEDKR